MALSHGLVLPLMAGAPRCRVRSAVNALQIRDGHMDVDLGAFDAEVSEHFLHIPNVCSMAQHVRRGGVAKGVAGATFTDAGTTYASADKLS